MRQYMILLPPSEGKADGGRQPRKAKTGPADGAKEAAKHDAFAVLNPQREALIGALQAAIKQQSRAELQKLFGVKGDALDAAIAANLRLPHGPCLPAIERYTGVLFDFMDYATLPPAARRTFNRRVILFSGLWGLVRPTDRIPDYKLKIDAALPQLGKVSTFWKPQLSAALNPLLSKRVVWDLLPNAHAAAWQAPPDLGARWQVKFVERVEKQNKVQYRTVSHWSKALKGALVRFICANDVVDPTDFQDFAHPLGYEFRADQSEIDPGGGVLIFVKE